MVFRGKPSRGCANCRKRKIGCDRTRDRCLNCSRASFACPGYRNELDLAFFDENARTVQRVQQQIKHQTRMTSATVLNDRRSISYSDTRLTITLGVGTDNLEHHQRRLRSPRPTYQPDLALDDISYDFFYLHYTIESPRESRQSRKRLDRSQLGPADVLQASIKAVGGAYLASFNHSVSYETYTQHLYGTAVQSLNSLLKDPSAVRDDRVLLAVILLGYFEEMDVRSKSRLGAREAHLLGGVSLLKLRGLTRLKKPAEIRLFGQLTNALTNFCIQQQTYLPIELTKLVEDATPHVFRTDLSWHVFRNKIDFASFYVQTVRSKVTNPSAVLREALYFDELFAAHSQFADTGWTYKTFRTRQRNGLLVNGTYHIYNKYVAAMVWNGIRGYRMLANRLVFEVTTHMIETCSETSEGVLSKRKQAKSLIRELQLDVLASVPQHLGLVTKSEPKRIDFHQMMKMPAPKFLWTGFDSINFNPAVSTAKDDTLPLIRMFGGCLLPYSLNLVDLVDLGGEDSLTKPVLEILKTMSDCMAIEQAKFYAEEVVARQSRERNLLRFQ